MADLAQLPLFPLEVVLFPGMTLPLHIFEPRYRLMVSECLERKEPFGVVLKTADPADERASGAAIARVGCTAEVVQLLNRHPDGRLDILTEGRRRFRITATDEERPYLQAEVDWLDDPTDEELAEVRGEVLALYRRTFLAHVLTPTPAKLETKANISYDIAGSHVLDLRQRQALLELPSEHERLASLAETLREIEGTVRLIHGNGRARQFTPD